LTPAATPEFIRQPGSHYFYACEFWKSLAGVRREAALNLCANPYTVVTVPARFVDWRFADPCYTSDSHPDTCPVHLNGSDQPERAVTYVGRYPPLYYAIVGLPSLASQSDAGVYAMRLVSGFLVAMFLGLALAMAATWSSFKMLFLSITVAASPIVLVFGSAVNPNGLEMAASVCTWTGGLLLVLEHFDRPPVGLIVGTAAASMTLALSRPLSTLWLVIIALFVIALRPASILTLAADRRVRIGFTFVVAAFIAALSYAIWAQALNVLPVGGPVAHGTSEWTLIKQTLGQARTWFNQFSGAFGWENTSPPLIGRTLLAMAMCGVVTVSVFTAARRRLVVLVVLTVTAALLPPLIEVSQVKSVGFDWYARYSYPLYGGVIVMAGAITQLVPIREPTSDPSLGRRVRWFTAFVASCVAASQILDVLWAIRRYSVGLSGPLNVFDRVPGKFYPPVPLAILVGGAVFFCAIYCGVIIKVCRRPVCAWRHSRGTSHDERDARAARSLQTRSPVADDRRAP
jgi:hypothetical protein